PAGARAAHEGRARFLSTGRGRGSPPPASPTRTMADMPRVLVVDDESRIVRVVRDYLEHSGFEVLTAGDGPSALRAARTGKPDLLILDLALPGLDGLDVARAIRKEGELPIIMLTARVEEADRVAGL